MFIVVKFEAFPFWSFFFYLSLNFIFFHFKVRGPGVEPGQFAWKANVIPLDHPRLYWINNKRRFKGFLYKITRLRGFGPHVRSTCVPKLDHKPKGSNRDAPEGI